jgi:hypothetical protein
MNFMRSAVAISSAYAALLIASPALAEVHTLSSRDDIAGTVTKYVVLTSQNYREITNENKIVFRCAPDGQLEMRWWIGGRYDSEAVMIMTYKVDAGEPRGLKINTGTPEVLDGEPPTVTELIDQFSRGNTLIAKAGISESSDRFSLSGAARAFATFRPQCLK